MLETVICLAAMFAISFTIKETDGPFNILLHLRLALLRNKYVGTFFYSLLQCYFCVGFWSGAIVYLLAHHFQYYNGYDLLLWSFAGSTISFLTNIIVGRN